LSIMWNMSPSRNPNILNLGLCYFLKIFLYLWSNGFVRKVGLNNHFPFCVF
jgi:hypothetical protein